MRKRGVGRFDSPDTPLLYVDFLVLGMVAGFFKLVVSIVPEGKENERSSQSPSGLLRRSPPMLLELYWKAFQLLAGTLRCLRLC